MIHYYSLGLLWNPWICCSPASSLSFRNQCSLSDKTNKEKHINIAVLFCFLTFVSCYERKIISISHMATWRMRRKWENFSIIVESPVGPQTRSGSEPGMHTRPTRGSQRPQEGAELRAGYKLVKKYIGAFYSESRKKTSTYWKSNKMPVGAHFTHVLFVCKSVLDLLTYEPFSLKNVPEGPAHLIGAKDR